jgi:hypothetical protein
MDIREIINAHVNGGTFISIDTETPVKLTGGKSNPLQGRVTKRVTGSNVMVFQNKTINAYDAMVKRRLEKEGKDPASFVIGPRQWGEREDGTPFVNHNGKMYLEVIFLSCGNVEYLVDGQPYIGNIQGLPVATEGHQGGLDNKVIIRTYTVENIKSITINHNTYERDGNEFVEQQRALAA